MLEMGDVSPADVDSPIEVTDEFRSKYPEKDDEELSRLLATVQKGLEVQKTINESYDTFAKEELNASEHRFEIELEKLYRRFFQAGKKKRYAGLKIWTEG
jgi:DNA polymerase I